MNSAQHTSNAASRAELIAVTSRIEVVLSAQTQILERLAVAETESTYRDKAIARVADDVAALRKAQEATALLVAKAAGAAGLAGVLLPYIVKYLTPGG